MTDLPVYSGDETGPNLVAFLEARIADDEQLARDAVCHCGGPVCTPMAAFVVEHSPARVLRECAAKRKILEIHCQGDPFDQEDADGNIPGRPVCDRCGTPGEYDCSWPCETVKALAAAYSDHQDYEEAWRV